MSADQDLRDRPWYFPPVDSSQCDREHPPIAGPNMDIGQCAQCWAPMGILRSGDQSFGWHADDCSLPMRHAGQCEPGGDGHLMPAGWLIRG